MPDFLVHIPDYIAHGERAAYEWFLNHLPDDANIKVTAACIDLTELITRHQMFMSGMRRVTAAYLRKPTEEAKAMLDAAQAEYILWFAARGAVLKIKNNFKERTNRK